MTTCDAYIECVQDLAARTGNSAAYDQARMLFGATACGQTAQTRAACEQGCARAIDTLAQTGTTCSAAGGGTDGGGGGGGSADGGTTTLREDDNAACSDGLDNDGDGYFDCVDYSCSRNSNVTVCSPTPSTPPTPSFEDSNAACTDGIDNDQDGYLDCDDFDCSRNPSVTVCASANESCSDCVHRVSNGACLSPANACGSNVSCQSYIQCISACPNGDTNCYTTCRNQDPTGAAKYDTLSVCLDPYCGSKC